MSKNVKIKRKDGASWVQLFPETVIEQITNASVVGKNTLGIETPLNDGMLRVSSSGGASVVAMADVAAAIGAAAPGHGHVISQITDLELALSNRAELEGGKVKIGNLPSFVLGGARHHGDLSANTHINNDLLSEVDIGPEHVGKYWIARANITLEYTSGVAIQQSVGNEGQYLSGMTLEAGDWLIFNGYDESNIYQFGVVNNTYRTATSNYSGVVKLSQSAATNRYGLSASESGEKVVHEKLLRAVMRDIHYGTSTPDAETGDIWMHEQAV